MRYSMLMISSLRFILGEIKSVAISFSQVYFMQKNLLFPRRVISLVYLYHECLPSQIRAPPWGWQLSFASAFWAVLCPLNAVWEDVKCK